MDLNNAGYDILLTNTALTLLQDNKIIHSVPKNKSDQFWTIPLTAPGQSDNNNSNALCNAVMSLPSDRSFVQFIHASFGSPAVSTFLRAIRNDYLTTVPRLTSAIVSTHLHYNPIATAIGHLDQRRQGIDSTRPPPPNHPVKSPPLTTTALADFSPTADDTLPTELFCKIHSTADLDATGRFPVQSTNKMEYMLVSYFNGYIHVEPLSSRGHAAYIDAYERTFTFWKQYGPLPVVVRLDNETSHQLEQFIKPLATFQYFPPSNHRANRAERAIRTWKNHFISTIATASPQFPLSRWDKLIPIAELTLNCMLPWLLDPTISSYHGLTGAKFDFQAHPIAPAGTSILIHDKPGDRATWSPHGTAGFYLGPALAHYRCHNVYSSVTHTSRVTDTVAWFPSIGCAPTPLDPTELILAALRDLTSTLKRYHSGHPAFDAIGPALVTLSEMYAPISTALDPAGDPVDGQRVPIALKPTSDQRVPVPDQAPLPIPPLQSIQSLQSAPAPVPAASDPTPTTNPSPAHPALHRHLTRSSTAWARLASTTAVRPTQWTRQISHLAQASNVTSLNLNADGSPLTYKTARAGPDREHWYAAEDAEISRLIDTGTMTAIMRNSQPTNRRKDTTYYNPKPKEKFDLDNTSKLYRIRGTIGGDRIHYLGDTKANTAAMPVVKMLLQSTISEDAQWMTIDIKDFYLNTLLPRSEYLSIPLKFLSPAMLIKYNLKPYVDNGHVLFEVLRSMYGLPHAGRIAQEALILHLASHHYLQTSTPCLFKHTSNGTCFTLVVDDFGIKYRTKDTAQHLIDCLQLKYKLTIRWEGERYLGMTVLFDRTARHVQLSIPGYIRKVLQRFAPSLTIGAKSPGIYTPPRYGQPTEQSPTVDDSPRVSPAEQLNLQGLIGAVLYYCLAVDPTGLPVVTALASAQSRATASTIAASRRLLAYFFNYPDNKLTLKACEMRLHIQSDASYLSRPNAGSVAGGIAYLSNSDPSEISGAIHCMSSLISGVMSSVAEAEYVSLFMNAQHGAGLRSILADLGYPQEPTTILVDNQCARDIATSSIQPKRTKSIDMRYHWIRDRVKRREFSVVWRPGIHNLADFFTKPLPVHVHQSLMPLLVTTPPTPPTLQSRARLRAANWLTISRGKKGVLISPPVASFTPT